MSDNPILVALAGLEARLDARMERFEAGQEALANRLDRVQHEQ